MPRMYGILAVGGWVATLVVAVLLIVIPKRADQDEKQAVRDAPMSDTPNE